LGVRLFAYELFIVNVTVSGEEEETVPEAKKT